MKKGIISDLSAYLLVLLFIYTAASKLLNYSDFVFVLNQTKELKPFAGILSILLPLIEIIAAVLLVIPNKRRAGLYLSFGLMASFTLYAAYIAFFALHRPCACGGVIKGLNWKQHTLFNMFFTLVALVGILVTNKPSLSDREVRFT